MMKKTAGILCFAVLIGLTAAPPAEAQDEILQSVWTAQAPKIDGNPDDWGGISRSVWKKGNVEYSFRNDAQTLYVLLTFKDPQFRSSMEATGIILYFNAAGKEKKDYGLLFKKKRATAEETIAFIEKSETLSDERKAQIRGTAYYNLYLEEVLINEAKAPSGEGKESGRPALFKYANQKKEFTYEFAVPMARFIERASAGGAAPVPVVTIGFEWGGRTEEQKKQAARAGANTGIANEEPTRSSGIDSMGRGGGASGPSKYTFWCQVQLAKSGQ
jgi:hypothetical protein